MTPEFAISLAQDALKVALMVGAPVLGFGLLAGLLISVFQASTQINEASLQFLPKVLAGLLGMVIFGPWMLNTLMDFARHIFQIIPDLVK